LRTDFASEKKKKKVEKKIGASEKNCGGGVPKPEISDGQKYVLCTCGRGSRTSPKSAYLQLWNAKLSHSNFVPKRCIAWGESLT
jgi:hypothetical protein